MSPVKQPIAIVGASARAAAASAVRAGFQPITADLFADADLREIATVTRISPYPEGLLDWLRAIEPPAWMYTGALENHPELIDQMAWIAPLWGNPGDVLQRVRAPHEMAKILGDADLLFPETRGSADGLPRDGSWLVKTCKGASGSGVRVLSTEYNGPGMEYDSSREIPSSELRLLFQRRIAGVPCAAAFSAMDNTAILLGITRQIIGESWLGAHGFQYAGSIGPLPVPDAAEETIKRIGQVLAEQFELAGVFGVDFMLDGEQVWTIEVNPRYTASMEICERVTGIYTVAAHVSAWANSTHLKLPAARLVHERAHGKAILFAKRDIQVADEFAEMSLAEALPLHWPTLADVSPAGTMIEAGRPILTLFAEGDHADEVEQRLRRRAVELERQIYGSEFRT